VSRVQGDVAVIIPCYNLGDTIEETVASVLSQTRPASEVVIIDDGSDAATQIVLSRLASDLVRVIRAPHQGVAKSRDLGCMETTSPYVLWLDADDLIMPTYLEKTAARLDADATLSFVSTAFEAFGEASFCWTPPAWDDVVRHVAEGSYLITTLFRRTLWQELGGCDPALPAAEDWDFWLGVVARGRKGDVVAEPLFRYRIRRGSRNHRGYARETHHSAMQRILTKHRTMIEGLGKTVLDAKRRDLENLRGHVEHLDGRRIALEGELERLERELADARAITQGLAAPAAGCLPATSAPATRSRHRPAGLVLLYHRVAVLEPDTFRLCIAPDEFREHMQHLAENFRPMSLDALVDAADAGDIPDRATAVTLDDGDLDALTASEILAQLGIPATFYINTDRLTEPHEAWHDVLERVFLSNTILPERLLLEFVGRHIALPCGGQEARTTAFNALYQIGWSLDADGRRTLVDALVEWSGVPLTPRDSHRLLTAAEVTALAARPEHQVGCHTVNHLYLPVHSPALQEREIRENKRVLEELLAKPVRSLAYPYGAITKSAVETCRRLGFHSATTVVERPLRPWDDPLLVPRYEIKACSRENFAALLERIFASIA
jgi:peptidoglycan/xylan/chitin deacetylase (PgdA/CDA1 family)